jgi:hypothetical protein
MFISRSEELKRDCLRYSKTKLEDDDLLSSKQDSSSGIESGSSHSGSGTNSPISFDEKLSETEVESSPILLDKNGKIKAPLKKVKVAGQSINTYVEADQVSVLNQSNDTRFMVKPQNYTNTVCQ